MRSGRGNSSQNYLILTRIQGCGIIKPFVRTISIYKCKKGGNLEMQHGRKWLHKLLTPIVALALVLTGISFQGLAAMEAAETEEAGGLAAYGEAEGAEDLAACDQAEETEEPAAYAEVEETEKPAVYGGAEGKLERACEKAESGLEAMDAEEDDETEDDGEADETDKSALTEAIRRANQLKQAAYSAASWKKLKTALDAANKINDKEDGWFLRENTCD